MTTSRFPLAAAALIVLSGCGDIVTEPRAAAEAKFEGTVAVTVDGEVAHAWDGLIADSLGLCAPDPDQCAVDSIHVVMDGDQRFQVQWTPPPLALADSLEWRYRLYFAGPGDPHYVHYTWLIRGDTAITPRNRMGCRRQEILDFARRVEVRPEVVVRDTDYQYVHRSDRGARRVHRWPLDEWLDPLDESECTPVVDRAAVLDQIAKACGGRLDPDGRLYDAVPSYPSAVLSGTTLTWAGLIPKNGCLKSVDVTVAGLVRTDDDKSTQIETFGEFDRGILTVVFQCPPNVQRFNLYVVQVDLTYIQREPFALVVVPVREVMRDVVVECPGS